MDRRARISVIIDNFINIVRYATKLLRSISSRYKTTFRNSDHLFSAIALYSSKNTARIFPKTIRRRKNLLRVLGIRLGTDRLLGFVARLKVICHVRRCVFLGDTARTRFHGVAVLNRSETSRETSRISRSLSSFVGILFLVRFPPASCSAVQRKIDARTGQDARILSKFRFTTNVPFYHDSLYRCSLQVPRS